MADNVELNAGSGGDSVAADDIGGVKFPRSKIVIGADGTNDGDVSAANPLPIAAGTGVTLPVSAEALPLPAGAATSANQATAIAGLVSIDTSLAAIKTAAELLDNAISGNEMQVDVVAPLPAGTNAIGKLAANDGVDIGDVTINNTTLPLPTGASTLAEQQTQTTHLGTLASLVQTDSVFAGTKITSPGYLYDDSKLYDPSPGNVGLARMSEHREQYTVIRDAAGNERGANVNASGQLAVAGPVTNAGTFAVQESGTALTHLANIAAGSVQYTEDAEAAANPTGTAIIVIRDDGQAGSLTSDDGDNVAVRGTDKGEMYVLDASCYLALQTIDNVLGTISNATLQDDAEFTIGTSRAMIAGYIADEASTDSIDEGDGGAARMTLDRKQIVTPQPHTRGGVQIFRSLDLDESEEEVKGTAGQLYGFLVTNRATSTRWIKFYNAAAANVTVGTTTPVLTWGIPGNSSDNISAAMLAAMGIEFDTAISVAATTGFADDDTGAPGANEVIINVFYK